MTSQKSVASNMTALIGVASLSIGIALQTLQPAETKVGAAIFLIFCYLVPVALYELLVRKVHRLPSTGLDWDNPRPANLRRVGVKLVGFLAVLGAVFVVHAFFRIYSLPRLLNPLVGFMMLAPFFAPIVLIYFYEIDRRMKNPHDGYLEFGNWVLRRNRTPDWNLLKSFAVGWAIKGFFLPVMFAYLSYNMPTLGERLPEIFLGPIPAVAYLAKVLVVVELTVVVVGYTMTLRLFDAHIRSPNMFLGAWVVTMICYEPFNRVTSGRIYDFRNELNWVDVAGNYSVLMWPWMALILVAFFVWTWATAIFGLRWSNLTHRGIITNGPYKYCKHPDYVAKSCFFWLTVAPFLTAASTWQGVTATVALVVVNGVYFGRARMEEKHLSEDPDYVAYALEMNRHSVFAPIARLVPFLIYKAPDGRTGLADGGAQTPAAMPAE